MFVLVGSYELVSEQFSDESYQAVGVFAHCSGTSASSRRRWVTVKRRKWTKIQISVGKGKAEGTVNGRKVWVVPTEEMPAPLPRVYNPFMKLRKAKWTDFPHLGFLILHAKGVTRFRNVTLLVR